MNIQITTNSGQKYVMKGEEFAAGFAERMASNVTPFYSGTIVENATAHLKDFLATYEEEPTTDV